MRDAGEESDTGSGEDEDLGEAVEDSRTPN
jgi:hypothetical protein